MTRTGETFFLKEFTRPRTRPPTGGDGLRVGGGCYAVVSPTVRLAVLCLLTILGLAVGVLTVALLVILLTVLTVRLLTVLAIGLLLTVLRLLVGLLRLRAKATETRVTLRDILRH